MKLVFLGLGFISTNVAYFLSEKHNITVTYKSLNPVKEKYVKILKDKKVEVVNLDIKDEQKLSELIKSSDMVVNFIGEISGSEEELRISNTEVPKTIASIVNKYGKIMIHLSGSTYGRTGYVKVEEKIGEGLNPQSPFEKTKLQGELEVYKILGDKAFIFRPTLVYGRFNAHVQFIQIYKLVRRGIIPNLNLNFMPVSSRYIAEAIDAIANGKRASKNYFYVTECDPVNLTVFFELFSKALSKRGVKIPVPLSLAKLFLPSYVKALLKYAGTIYDCSVFRELVPKLQFDEKEVQENAKFLNELDKEGILIPT